MLQTCIWKMPNSNSHKVTEYPDQGFLQHFYNNNRIVPWLIHDHLLLTPFKFIIPESSSHSTLYNLYFWQCHKITQYFLNDYIKMTFLLHILAIYVTVKSETRVVKISHNAANLCSRLNTVTKETNIGLQKKFQYQVYSTFFIVPEVHSVVASSKLRCNLGYSPSA